MRRPLSSSSVTPAAAAPVAARRGIRDEVLAAEVSSIHDDAMAPGEAVPRIDDLVDATCDAVRSPTPVGSAPPHSGSVHEPIHKLSPMQTMSHQLRRVLGAGESRVRRVSAINVLEDDIVAQNYRRLRPIELLESGDQLVDKTPPSDTHPVSATLGILLLFTALAIASSPLFFRSIDAESLVDNSGLLVKKNASFAKAYFLGNGFYADFIKNMKSNNTAGNWFPQPTDTKFINYSYMNPSAYAAFGTGACAILNPDPANPIDCILMTGHQGTVSPYGLCRNGSEFIAMQYISGLVTPADVGGLISAGTWVENTREVILTGLKKPPECVDGKKILVYPSHEDRRLLSGPFVASVRGSTYQWLDQMNLPTPVRARMFYLTGKSGGRLGLTLPTSKRQSFDEIIAQNTFGSTLADMLEIQAPFAGSTHVYFMLYRVAGARIFLPRLQFTFAVAAQSLGLLAFLLALTLRNGPVRSYHLMVQILRLPTFCIISLQLMYVLYYQIFSIGYLATNPSLSAFFEKKVIYVAGVSYILMQQLDVRAAVTLWPRMANNDSYYLARLGWMLGSLGLFMWSLNENTPDHYVVASKPNCPLGAMECNTSDIFFFQHWICLGIFISHPIAYGAIQVLQWRRNRSEYHPRDERHPDYLTSFEAYGCGGPLTQYYYYHTLVSKEVDGSRAKDGDGGARTLQYLTCAKAVRDEGFVLLGGCNALVRAKDVYVFMLMKLIPRRVAGNLNLSVVVAHIVELRLTPMRRISYEALWTVAHRWDGGVSYPDIG